MATIPYFQWDEWVQVQKHVRRMPILPNGYFADHQQLPFIPNLLSILRGEVVFLCTYFTISSFRVCNHRTWVLSFVNGFPSRASFKNREMFPLFKAQRRRRRFHIRIWQFINISMTRKYLSAKTPARTYAAIFIENRNNSTKLSPYFSPIRMCHSPFNSISALQPFQKKSVSIFFVRNMPSQVKTKENLLCLA